MFYKYLKKEHLDQFRETGKIAIGNIELYRDIENTTILDPFEGKTVYSLETKDEPVFLSVDQVNAITNDYHITSNFKIGPNSYFQDSLKVPNAFTFSLSSKLDDQLMSLLGYDAFYAIKDINAFQHIIYKELNKMYKLLYSVIDKVRYVPTKILKITNANKDQLIRTSPFKKEKSEFIKTIYIEDYFTKLDRFKHEVELRILFIPSEPISKQLILLNCIDLLDHCYF
jgi:hypothetical protein